MSRYRHRVIANCFIGDVFRTPEKHNIVVTKNPFTKNEEDDSLTQLPKSLEPLDYDFDDDGNPNVEDVPEADDEIDATDGALALASEFAIDLTDVEGSGKEGRITKDDVQAIIDELG